MIAKASHGNDGRRRWKPAVKKYILRLCASTAFRFQHFNHQCGLFLLRFFPPFGRECPVILFYTWAMQKVFFIAGGQKAEWDGQKRLGIWPAHRKHGKQCPYQMTFFRLRLRARYTILSREDKPHKESENIAGRSPFRFCGTYLPQKFVDAKPLNKWTQHWKIALSCSPVSGTMS